MFTVVTHMSPAPSITQHAVSDQDYWHRTCILKLSVDNGPKSSIEWTDRGSGNSRIVNPFCLHRFQMSNFNLSSTVFKPVCLHLRDWTGVAKSTALSSGFQASSTLYVDIAIRSSSLSNRWSILLSIDTAAHEMATVA